MKIDTRRAAIQRDIGALREALGEAALRLEEAGDDPGRLAAAQAQLAQVQHELAGAEARLVAYDAGVEARTRQEAQRATAETEAEVASLIARIADLNRAAISRAGRIARAIETLGAEYAALLTDLGEGAALCQRAVYARAGGIGAQRLAVGIDGHDVVSGAVGPALASSGVGVIGPSLSPWLIVTPPSNAFEPVRLPSALERLHERRLDAIERAATFGKQEAAA